MPPRAMIGAIVVFWLATIGWMLSRDQPPEEDLPPPFKFELADEVATKISGVNHMVLWEINLPDAQGICQTRLNRLPYRMFDLDCEYKLTDREIKFGKVKLRKVHSKYLVSTRGEVTELSTAVESTAPEFQFRAAVRADAQADRHSWELQDPGHKERPPVATVASLQSAFIPLHPRSTIPGLYAGQTWKATVIDPLENARRAADPARPRAVHTQTWRARVREEEFAWTKKVYRPAKIGGRFSGSAYAAATTHLVGMAPPPSGIGPWSAFATLFPGRVRAWWESLHEPRSEDRVTYHPCWLIQFTDDRGAERARIWVCQEDDWVLCQEVIYPEGTLKLVRLTDKKR